MAGPFYNNIKGVTAGTPGTGAFTPSGAATGTSAWSTVPTGWLGLVRYEDGSAWELQYSYWNGTTLSRNANVGGTLNQFVSSSSGSGLTLTSAATAAMIADANEVGPDACGLPTRGYLAIPSATTVTALGVPAVVVTGTASSRSISSSNLLANQPRVRITSATTANAQAGWTSTASWASPSNLAGKGGFQFNARFGFETFFPTNPRIFIGLSNATYVSSTVEPSAFAAAGNRFVVLGKDSTDGFLQLISGNAVSATKISLGISLNIGYLYDLTLWQEPGSLDVKCLFFTEAGQIFYGTVTTNTPSNGTALVPQCLSGLNGTNTGTAIVMEIAHLLFRQVV